MPRSFAAHERSEPYAKPGTGFCLAIAACAIALRLVLFESDILFGICIPNHDMSQGLAFFGTSMQNLRLTGDIVWWSPMGNGYAQYYQSFLSPLAPTPGHITFISWAYAVRLLAWCGAPLPPEYVQYVGFNYLLLPFLTYWALGELGRALFDRRASIVLLVMVYALSSIGLWNAAWFYFQESCTVFFLMTAFVRAVRYPGSASFALLAAALVIQLASANYWSLYNAIFLVLFVGSYGAFNARAVRRSIAASVALVRRNRAAQVLTLLTLLTAALWIVLIRSIAREQTASYGAEDAAVWMGLRAKGLRTFTIDFFNPGLEIALENFRARNSFGGLEPPIHDARYLGVTLLPLLALLPFLRWHRATTWLVPFAAGLFVVALAPRPLVALVLRIPFLNEIQHLFYFYTTHLQLSIVLLAAAALGDVAGGSDGRGGLLREKAATAFGVSILVAALAWHFRDRFPGFREHADYYFRAFGISVVSSALVLGAVARVGLPSRRVSLLAFLALTVVDVGAYFRHGSELDRDFTSTLWRVPVPLEDALRERLFEPMSNPDPRQGWEAGLAASIPLRSYFWPANRYLPNKLEAQGEKHPDVTSVLDSKKPVDFFVAGRVADQEMLVVTPAERAPTSSLAWRWLAWGYNDAGLSVETQEPGWLVFPRLFDPVWTFTVDGRTVQHRPANYTGTAIHVDGGAHEIRMTYRPLARAMYGTACALLTATVGSLVWVAVRRRGQRLRVSGGRKS